MKLNGNVYFEIEKFKDYTKLANLSIDELEAGSRIEIDPNKKSIRLCALVYKF